VTSPGAGSVSLRSRIPADLLRSLVVSLVAAVVVVESLRRGVVFAEKVSVGIVVAWLIVVCAHRPHVAVVGIVAWVPLQVPFLSLLFRLGAPAAVVRNLGYLKEFWALSLLLALFVAPAEVRRRRRLDALDLLALGYIAIATSYLLIPFVAPGTLGGQPFIVRLNAWRAEALFVVVFFCIRQLRFSATLLRRARRIVLVVAVVVAAFALWEAVNRSGFDRFLANTLGYPGYRAEVLKVPPGFLVHSTDVAGRSVSRAGSLFADPLELGFFMLIPLGIGLERLGARRLSPLAAVATAGALLAVVLSVTRSAALGAGVAGLLAVGLGSRRSPGRLRMLIILGTTAAVLLPAAGHSSLKARFVGVFSGSRDSESQGHLNAIDHAFRVIVADPVGRGLGSNTATGGRFQTGIQITSEDSYLETGAEIGMAAMVVFVLCLLMLLIELRARSKLGGRGGELANGMWLGGWGLAVGALFLQTWLEIATALVYWTLAGLALADVTGDDEQPLESHGLAVQPGALRRASA
jgi:hypothetical protein